MIIFLLLFVTLSISIVFLFLFILDHGYFSNRNPLALAGFLGSHSSSEQEQFRLLLFRTFFPP